MSSCDQVLYMFKIPCIIAVDTISHMYTCIYGFRKEIILKYVHKTIRVILQKKKLILHKLVFQDVIQHQS